MQNNFSPIFLNSLVPPNDNIWSTNARYKSTVSRVGCILIFHTWSACWSYFLFSHQYTRDFLCDYWNAPSRLPCVQSLSVVFRTQAVNANDQGCINLQRRGKKAKLVCNGGMNHWSLDILLSSPPTCFFKWHIPFQDLFEVNWLHSSLMFPV